MWWTYVVTFVGSLIVSLVSVWISQTWAGNRRYKEALENFRSEVNTNIKVAYLICQWIDMNLETVETGKMITATTPRLSELAWNVIKGSMSIKDYDLATKLEDVFQMAEVVNDLTMRIDDLKWGIASVVEGVEERKRFTLQETREIITNNLLPRLKDAKNVIDKRLGSPSASKGEK